MPAHQDDHPPRLATEENPLRSGRGKKTEEDFINGEFLEEDAGRRKSNFKLALLHQFHFAADRAHGGNAAQGGSMAAQGGLEAGRAKGGKDYGLLLLLSRGILGIEAGSAV